MGELQVEGAWPADYRPARRDATVAAVSVQLGGHGHVACYFETPQRVEDVVALRRILNAWAVGIREVDA